MKIFGTLVSLFGIGMIAMQLHWVGISSLISGVLIVLFNSKMSET